MKKQKKILITILISSRYCYWVHYRGWVLPSIVFEPHWSNSVFYTYLILKLMSICWLLAHENNQEVAATYLLLENY